MIRLDKLLQNMEITAVTGDREVGISSLTFDSRSAGAGSLFFAVRGSAADGHAYIADAIGNGATAVICETIPEKTVSGATYVQVGDSGEAAGMAASAFYGNPSAKLRLVGVTGTNGKTTTATLLYELFKGLGYRAGLISTIQYRVGDSAVDATHTTPDAIRLNGMLARMADEGCEYCFMEVSSHSVVQRRIAGLTFAGGIFTNLTHDHLDYHGTFAEYIKAKKTFFDALPPEAFALINADDRNGSVMVQNTRARVSGMSMRVLADFTCRVIETHFDGMLLNMDSREVWVRFAGRFNACNLLGVYAAASLLGVPRDAALRELSKLTPVRGRFETIPLNGITAIIDYAHTPDALQNVIETIDQIRGPGAKLYVVAGCGGNRDASKRPVMGRIAASGGDLAILTSDNPRLEEPDEIIAQMKEGIRDGDRYLAIADRREAIRTAAMMASAGDIILIAGKGHETYQDRKGVKTHFDDREEVLEAFARLRGANPGTNTGTNKA